MPSTRIFTGSLHGATSSPIDGIDSVNPRYRSRRRVWPNTSLSTKVIGVNDAIWKFTSYNDERQGDEILVQWSVDNGADVNQVKNGITPLFASTYLKKTTITKILLDNGADVNQANEAGITPLLNAIENEHQKIKLEEEAIRNDPTLNPDEMETLLVRLKNSGGIRSNDIAPKVSLLLDYKANVNQASDVGETPLLSAIRQNLDEIVKLLVQRGADVNQANSKGELPLKAACGARSEVITKFLLDNGATWPTLCKNNDPDPEEGGCIIDHISGECLNKYDEVFINKHDPKGLMCYSKDYTQSFRMSDPYTRGLFEAVPLSDIARKLVQFYIPGAEDKTGTGKQNGHRRSEPPVTRQKSARHR